MNEDYGDETARDIYSMLKRMAKSRLGGNSLRNQLTDTSLVHDAILRMGNLQEFGEIRDERRFFATASYAMRSVIVDKARKEKNKWKVLKELQAISNSSFFDQEWTSDFILRLDAAISKLTEVDALTASVVHLRVFLGLTQQQIADQLDISYRTTQRIWVYAKAWLRAELQEDEEDDGDE